MGAMPELVPISDLRIRQNEILSKLESGPVVLTQHNRARAVLIDIEQWRQMVEELEDLQDALTSLESRLADREPPIPLDQALEEIGLGERVRPT